MRESHPLWVVSWDALWTYLQLVESQSNQHAKGLFKDFQDAFANWRLIVDYHPEAEVLWGRRYVHSIDLVKLYQDQSLVLLERTQERILIDNGRLIDN